MTTNTFTTMSAIPNKMLNADGSMTTLDGKIEIQKANANGVKLYSTLAPIPNKMLNADGTISNLSTGGSSSGSGSIHSLKEFNIDVSGTSIDCCVALGSNDAFKAGDMIIDGARFKDVIEQFADLKINSFNVMITAHYDSASKSKTLTWVVSSSAGLYGVGSWNKFNNTLNLHNIY